MPELPEVETIANGVHARIHGQTVRSVWTSNKPQTFKSPPDEIVETLTGSRIDRVHRVGKTIVVDLIRSSEHGKRPAQFLVHLGMTGRLLVSTPDTPVPLHTHAILTLSSGKELRFVDARRFGRLSVVGSADHETKYKGPGSEPLTIRSKSSSRSFAAARRRSRPRCSTSHCSMVSATSTQTRHFSTQASGPAATPGALLAPNSRASALRSIRF